MSLTQKKRKIIWYAVSVIFVISVYMCVHAHSRFFLFPYAKLTSAIWNIPFAYIAPQGYVSYDGALTISESCSGIKMFIALFLIAAVGFAPAELSFKNAVRAFISAAGKIAALTFALTFIRISMSLKLNYFTNAALAHNILSLIIFFGAACALYFYLNRKRRTIYEE